MNRPIINGHRGASGLAPENTLRSFERGIEIGVDRMELDVHLTRDGLAAVIHDDSLDRTTDGTGLVAGMTMAEIQKFDAGKGERVPELAEVLELIKGRSQLQIEIKSDGLERRVIDVVRDFNMVSSVWVSSFNVDIVARVRALAGDFNVSIICEEPPESLDAAMACKASSLDVHFAHADRALLELLRNAGLDLGVWTVDEPEDMKRMIELGPLFITTNRPDRLVKLLKGD